MSCNKMRFQSCRKSPNPNLGVGFHAVENQELVILAGWRSYMCSHAENAAVPGYACVLEEHRSRSLDNLFI